MSDFSWIRDLPDSYFVEPTSESKEKIINKLRSTNLPCKLEEIPQAITPELFGQHKPKETITFRRYNMARADIGVKYDDDKRRYDLVPSEALGKIVDVLTYGANKYDDRNWEKGIKWGRVFAATMRHMWAWWRREEKDDESSIIHLAHAGCNILFLIHFILNKKYEKFDDRPEIDNER